MGKVDVRLKIIQSPTRLQGVNWNYDRHMLEKVTRIGTCGEP